MKLAWKIQHLKNWVLLRVLWFNFRVVPGRPHAFRIVQIVDWSNWSHYGIISVPSHPRCGDGVWRGHSPLTILCSHSGAVSTIRSWCFAAKYCIRTVQEIALCLVVSNVIFVSIPMMTGMRIPNWLMIGGAGISLFARIPISIVGTPKHHLGVQKMGYPQQPHPHFLTESVAGKIYSKPYWLGKSQGGIHHVGFSLVPNILIFFKKTHTVS